MSETKGENAVVLSLLGGAVVGAGLALLFAPAPGLETRRKLRTWLKDTFEKGRVGIDQKKTQINAAYRAGKEAFQNTREKAGV